MEKFIVVNGAVRNDAAEECYTCQMDLFLRVTGKIITHMGTEE